MGIRWVSAVGALWHGGTMKGRISKNLAAVLRDPHARTQLRDLLVTRTDGRISTGGKTYSLRISSSEPSNVGRDTTHSRGEKKK